MKKVFNMMIVVLLFTSCTSTPLLPSLYPPENVYYTVTDNMVYLNWDKVVNAEGYFVHVNEHIFYTTVNQWKTPIDTYPPGQYQLSVSTMSQGRESDLSSSVVIEWPTPIPEPEIPIPEIPEPEPEIPEEPAPEPHVIGGILQEDTILSDTTRLYVVDGYLQIPYGVTLSVEPGVQVSQGSIQVWGNLQVVGVSGNHALLDNVDIVGVGAYKEDYTMVFDYVTFTGQMDMLYPTGNGGFGSLYLGHSIIESRLGWVYMWYPVGETVIEYNTFRNYVHFDIGFDGRDYSGGRSTVEIRNNTFSGGKIVNWVAYGETPLLLRYNNLINVQVALASSYHDTKIDARENYWGTTDEEVIQTRITDRNDSLEYSSVIPYTPFLKETFE